MDRNAWSADDRIWPGVELAPSGTSTTCANRLTKSCDAMGKCTTYSCYDADDNLTQVKSGTGIETDYKYDNFNRRKEIDYDVAAVLPVISNLPMIGATG